MSKHQLPFKFKQFEVEHSRSSMKVGVDAVILGAWIDIPQTARNVLDVGCGCGVISLMAAQRFEKIQIKALDCDELSVEECTQNIYKSPWSDRITAFQSEFTVFSEECRNNSMKFDYIFSNPPYFSDGLKTIDSPRLTARHQGLLNPHSLLQYCKGILADNGKLAIVIPLEYATEIMEESILWGYEATSMLEVSGRIGKTAKRCFLELTKTGNYSVLNNRFTPQNVVMEIIANLKEKKSYRKIYILDELGNHTPEYKQLCKDFYLKF